MLKKKLNLVCIEIKQNIYALVLFLIKNFQKYCYFYSLFFLFEVQT